MAMTAKAAGIANFILTDCLEKNTGASRGDWVTSLYQAPAGAAENQLPMKPSQSRSPVVSGGAVALAVG